MEITVVGIGRLGLGFALLCDKNGYNVVGVDVNLDYVNAINDRSFRTSEPEYQQLLQQSNVKATTNLEEGLRHSKYIYILVQTPNSGGDKLYDHSILSNLLQKINNYEVNDKHIIIGCTVMPTYINTIGNTLLDKCTNCTLSYNPEFIAQGSIARDFVRPDIVLLGSTNTEVHNFISKLYSNICINTPQYVFVTPLEAEIIKIGLNSFVTAKLSYANLISDLCDQLGADKDKVLDGIGSDSRIGKKYFRPGYSFGGPCFPRDTQALAKLVENAELPNELLRAVTNYNEYHIKYQTQQILAGQPDHYTFTDVGYKPNCPIIEESAKLKIAAELARSGCKVLIKDKEETVNAVKREYGSLFSYDIPRPDQLSAQNH